MKTLKAFVKAIFLVVAGLVLIIGISVIVIRVAHNVSMNKTIALFYENRSEFEQVLAEMKLSIDSNTETTRHSSVKYTVSQALEELDIGSIDYEGDNVYFNFISGIMGMTSYGVLYVNELEQVMDWFTLKQIDGNWYYYCIKP